MPGEKHADHPPVEDRVSQSQLIVIASAGVRLLLTLAATILIGRTLEPEDFGFFGLVIVLLVIAREMMDLGTGNLAVREIAIHPEREKSIVETLIGLRVIAGALLGVIVVLWALVQDQPHRTWILLATAATLPLLSFGAQTVIFLVRQDQAPPAKAAIALQTGFLSVCAAFYFFNAPVWSYAAAVIAREVMGILWLDRLTSKKLEFRLRPHWNLLDMRRMLSQVTAFSVAALTHNFYFYTGPLLVWLLLTPAEMGAYAAAFRPISALVVFPWLFAIPLLPGLTQLAKFDRATFVQQVVYLVPLSLGLGAIVGVAGFELSADALRLLFGDRYVFGELSAIRALQLLCLSMVFSTATATVITILMADGRERSIVPLSLTGLAIALLLNATLLPAFGFVAAAATTLVVEIWLWVIAIFILLRTLKYPKLSISALLPLLPAALLAASLQILPASFGWERIAIGAFFSASAIFMLLQLPVVRQGRKRFSEVKIGRSMD